MKMKVWIDCDPRYLVDGYAHVSLDKNLLPYPENAIEVEVEVDSD